MAHGGTQRRCNARLLGCLPPSGQASVVVLTFLLFFFGELASLVRGLCISANGHPRGAHAAGMRLDARCVVLGTCVVAGATPSLLPPRLRSPPKLPSLRLPALVPAPDADGSAHSAVCERCSRAPTPPPCVRFGSLASALTLAHPPPHSHPDSNHPSFVLGRRSSRAISRHCRQPWPRSSALL